MATWFRGFRRIAAYQSAGAGLIGEKLPVTLQLALMSMFFALIIGVPIGILAAVKQNTAIDYLANIVALSGLSIPNFGSASC